MVAIDVFFHPGLFRYVHLSDYHVVGPDGVTRAECSMVLNLDSIHATDHLIYGNKRFFSKSSVSYKVGLATVVEKFAASKPVDETMKGHWVGYHDAMMRLAEWICTWAEEESASCADVEAWLETMKGRGLHRELAELVLMFMSA